MNRMNQMLSVSSVLVVLAPAIAALIAWRQSTSRTAGFAGATGAGLGAVLSLFIFGALMTGTNGGSTGTTVLGIEFGVGVDRLLAPLLLLVTAVSCVVQAFASRYLHGDIRFGRFFLGAGLLTAATALMVSAETPATLAVGWTGSGVAVIALLGMYPGFRSADEGRRSTLIVFAAGDLALWTAVILSIAGVNDQALLGIGTSAVGGQETVAALVAVLLVIAALSRSAQLPFRSWLPGTIAVPTPVSALLHAGVVNAGGILLLKTSGIFTGSPLATHLAFAAGAVTAIYATAAMIARPDVKGSLAHSTSGQMGFMIMTCGLGAWVATIFHLIGHSLYKASLFLGSGSAVTSETSRIRKPHPTARRIEPASVAFAVLAPAVLLSAFALAWYPGLSWTSGAILAFAWATLAWGAWGWTGRSQGLRGMVAGAVLLTLAAAGYVGLISLAYDYLGNSIPLDAGSVASPLWLLAFVPVAIAGLVIRSRQASLPGKLDAAAYVQALNAARTGRSRTSRGSAERQLTGTGTLMPMSQEAR